MRTEEEVDLMIEGMIAKTKGSYITQGASFNKNCPRQMKMLKQALIDSVSFSGLVKEMLALRFDDRQIVARSNFGNVIELQPKVHPQIQQEGVEAGVKAPKLRSVGNFI